MIARISLCLLILFYFAAHASGAVLVETNFDSMSDWTRLQTTGEEACYTNCASSYSLPSPLTSFRNGACLCPNPPGSNNIYIDNYAGYPIQTETSYGGSGKSATFWDESCASGFEDSDGILGIDLGAEYDELYVRYKFRVKSGYQLEVVTGDDTSQHKMGGVQYYNGSANPYTYFEGSPNVPLTSWGWERYQNSIYMYVEKRCQNTYYCQDITVGYLSTVSQATSSGGIFDGNWHTLEARTRKNTSIGTSNGQFQLWVDGTSIINISNVPYNDSGSSSLRGFRFARVAGNNANRFTTSCSGTSCEQWWAIDDLVVSTTYVGTDYSPGGSDTTAPTVTISTTDPSSITSDSLSATGTASDAVGVSSCKWRLSSAPDGSNGTACTGTTSWTCSASGFSRGANTLYVGCGDAAGNWGSDSMIVNYLPVIQGVSGLGVSFR